MAFENSNGEYTFNALSYKANNRQGEMCLFSPSQALSTYGK